MKVYVMQDRPLRDPFIEQTRNAVANTPAAWTPNGRSLAKSTWSVTAPGVMAKTTDNRSTPFMRNVGRLHVEGAVLKGNLRLLAALQEPHLANAENYESNR